MLNMSMPQTLSKLSENEGGSIFETSSFKDGLLFIQAFAQRHPDKRKMAALDLDNTVVSYRHTLGTDHWFDFDFNAFMRQGLSALQTKDRILPVYLNIVRNIHPDDVYVVEEDTPAVVREIQASGVETIALTSRGSYLLEETIEQLARFQIDFNQGPYVGIEKKLPPSEEGLFTKGMILSAGQHKGECLLSALEQFGDLPAFIIMWDDKLNNLDKVRSSIKSYNDVKRCIDPNFMPVQFVGIRYSKLDHLVNNVDSRVTQLQKQYFQRILSDEHASAIAKAEHKKTLQHFAGIDFQPQDDSVDLSCHKNETYEKLLGICSDLVAHEVHGSVKVIQGKKKLTREFQFTVKEFESLFHLLSQHGLIEPSQFSVLDPIFNRPSAVLTPMLGLVRDRSTANTESALPANHTFEEKRMGAHL